MKKQLRGILILLLTAVIWGTGFAAQDDGMKYFDPFTFNALRMIPAAVALIPVAFFFEWRKSRGAKSAAVDSGEEENAVRRSRIRAELVGGIACGVLLSLASATQQYGIFLTASPGKAGFITSLYIILVPVIGICIRRVPQWTVWPCALLGAFGLWLICGSSLSGFGAGELFLLLCALLYSVQITAVDLSLGRGARPVTLSLIQFITASVVMTAFAFVAERPTIAGIAVGFASGWLPVLYLGLVSSAVGYTLQIVGQRDCPPVAASMLMSLESVFSVLAGWIFLRKTLEPLEIAGCLTVFVAVIISQIPVKQKKKA
ncbi:MAG: DMT family transporter [Clostridia bacterium]|nr:DMT family transporter [Clostridia bacterium]